MVDKKVSQKQQVKQTVKVIIGDVAKKRVKRKRAVKKGSSKAQVITFIQGSASGLYVPGSNSPYNPSTQLPVATGTEVRTKILEAKGDNPALNLSGSLSQSSQQRLEKNSMASNEGFPSKEQMIERLKKMKQDEVDEAKRAETIIPLREGNPIQVFPRVDTSMLGQVNVNMLDRNIPFIDDVRKAELKAKEKAFKKARQESIKRQVLNVMNRATTVPALPPKTKKKLLIEDF
jgi:hypothetical protein